MAFARAFEMSIGREELFRLLPAAVGAFEGDGDTVRFSDGGRPGRVRLVRLEDRRLGSVVVPRHRVEIALDEHAEAEGEAFLLRFHRAFLRGGG